MSHTFPIFIAKSVASTIMKFAESPFSRILPFTLPLIPLFVVVILGWDNDCNLGLPLLKPFGALSLNNTDLQQRFHQISRYGVRVVVGKAWKRTSNPIRFEKALGVIGGRIREVVFPNPDAEIDEFLSLSLFALLEKLSLHTSV